MDKEDIENQKEMLWRVHTVNLLTEIVDNALGPKMGILFQPINMFRRLLVLVTERAIQLNDPQLNILMLRLGLYEVPNDEITEAIENQKKLIEENKSNSLLTEEQAEKEAMEYVKINCSGPYVGLSTKMACIRAYKAALLSKNHG